MPFSSWETVPLIVEIIKVLRPATVLDIGTGSGKWGFIARELLDSRKGNFQKDDFKAIIDGIEIFPEYISDYHRHIYNQIYIDDICEAIKKVGNYDLAILGSCLEHLEEEKAVDLLNALYDKCKAILITVPFGYRPQEDCFGNPYETHRSTFTKSFFKEYSPFIKIIYRKRTQTGIILIHHEKHISRKLKRRFGFISSLKSLKYRLTGMTFKRPKNP